MANVSNGWHADTTKGTRVHPWLRSIGRIIVTLIATAAVLVAVLVFVLYLSFNNANAPDQGLLQAYQQVTWPSSMQFQSQTFNPGDIDAQKSWSFHYTVAGTRGAVYQAIESLLVADGFNLTNRTDGDLGNNSYSEDSTLSADDTQRGLQVELIVLPNFTNYGVDASSLGLVLEQQVSSVNVSAYRTSP